MLFWRLKCSLLTLLLLTSACEPTGKETTSNQPWRAGSRVKDEKNQFRSALFRLEAHQRIQFSVSTRKTLRVRGSWEISSSQLELRLDDLSHLKTKLAFPFHELRATKIHARAENMQIERTSQAMDWLLVAAIARNQASKAPKKEAQSTAKEHLSANVPEIRIDGLRGLEKRQAYQGRVERTLPPSIGAQFPQFVHQQDAEKLHFRSIKAKADLSVRLNSLETQTKQPVVIYFVYSEKVDKQSTPLAFILDWSRPIKVSFTEHNLQPR